jgi:[acyl-carrier-protein] S-malonyltransferase
VQWEGVVKRLSSEGVTTYVEVGPGTALSGLVRKIHPKAAVSSVGSPTDLVALEALGMG